MNIAYILPVNMQRFGYTKQNYLDSHFSIQIAKEVAKQGNQVSVHTFWSHDEIYQENNLKIFFHKTSLNYIFHEDFSSISLKLLNFNFPENTIIHFSEPNRLFYPLFILNKKNPIVLQHHGEGVVRPFPITSWLYLPFIIYLITAFRYFINKADLLIVSNNSAIKSFAKFGFPKKRILKYHRGIDLSKYKDFNKNKVRSELGINTNKIVFIFIGRISKAKGINELIKAFEELYQLNENLELIIIGPLEDKTYEKSIKNYWKGFKDTSELQKWLTAADVFVLPSYYEAFGIVLVQALFYNLPIIASNVGGIPEFVPKDKAIFIQPKSKDQLKNAMKKMLDKNFRKSKSRITRDMVMNKFSWQNVANKYINIYNEIINSKQN